MAKNVKSAQAHAEAEADRMAGEGRAVGARSKSKKSKTECPIGLEQFRKAAKTLVVKVDGRDMAVPTKEFSSGSFGWYGNEKITLTMDGVPVKFQVQVSIIAVGSKGQRNGDVEEPVVGE